MPDSIAAKQSILNSIRGAHARSANSSANIDYARIPRNYARGGKLDAEARLKLFTSRITDYDAGLRQVSADAVPETVAAFLKQRNRRRIAIPAGLPAAWLPEGFSFTTADDASAADLDCLDGFLSGCAVAIATTGTIVLQNAPGMGPRQLSLVPDYHLCVVFASQIVETVPDAFDVLAPTSTLPTTFISGPSATADIEMTRIKGVHGPRFLDVILVT